MCFARFTSIQQSHSTKSGALLDLTMLDTYHFIISYIWLHCHSRDLFEDKLHVAPHSKWPLSSGLRCSHRYSRRTCCEKERGEKRTRRHGEPRTTLIITDPVKSSLKNILKELRNDMAWYGMIYRKPRKVNRSIYTIIHAFVSTLLSDVFSRQLACNLRLTTSHFYSSLACVWLWGFVRFLCVCIFPPRMGFLSFYLCLIPLLACCVFYHFYPGLSLYNR